MSARRRRVRWRERSRLVRLARLWRTRHPITFREKVRYKMLRDRREIIVTFADKAAVRDHFASVIGEQYLPRAYAIADNSQDLYRLEWPSAYVIKPTHGSGAAIVVSPAAPATARLPEAQWGWVYRHVRPEFANPHDIIAIAEGWVTKLYGQGPNREWVYGQIPRRIIVEEFLTGADGAIPDDYKFFVFHGRCAYIQVDSGRFGRRAQDFYRPTWEHIPLSGGPPWADPARAARAVHRAFTSRMQRWIGSKRRQTTNRGRVRNRSVFHRSRRARLRPCTRGRGHGSGSASSALAAAWLPGLSRTQQECTWVGRSRWEWARSFSLGEVARFT